MRTNFTYDKILRALMLLFLTLNMATARGDKRVALIIGNSTYPDRAYANLPIAKNDAEQMEKIFADLGFKTYKILDANRQEILDAVKKVGGELAQYDVAVFYYSGHGNNFNYANYLVPSKTEFYSITSSDCFPVSDIESTFAKCPLSFIFIDACRSDAVTVENMADTKGTLTIPSNIGNNDNSPHGQMVFNATSNGDVAHTGGGKLSVFTHSLASRIYDKSDFRKVWMDIKNDVHKSCHQLPSEKGVYHNNFIFNSGGKAGSAAPLPVMPTQSAAELIELGKKYDNSAKTIAKAISYYEQATQMGSVEGTFLLAQALAFGNKATRDLPRAAKLLQQVIDTRISPWADKAYALKHNYGL